MNMDMLKHGQRLCRSLCKYAGAFLGKHDSSIPTPRRYEHLFKIIDKYKARRIMEIGTWSGTHAVTMIETAKKHWLPEEIEYYGFDLFGDMDEETFKTEISKIPPSITEVREKLEKTGAKIRLYKGNTLHTLPKAVKNLPQMDFIFIDGGHSLETVRNDWQYSRQLIHDQTIVVFDDYWNLVGSGCNKIIDSLSKKDFSVEILPPTDEFKKEWGILRINFVKVTKITKTGEKL